MAKGGKGKNAETDDALWARVTEGVTPLPGRKPGRSDPLPEPKTLPKRPAPRAVPASPSEHIEPRQAELTHGKAPGLDRKTQTNLRKGKVEIEGRIDLHGLTQAEAHRALIAFIQTSRDQGKRAVLVITGKGLRETGEIGVLRRSVPGWLNAPPLKPLIRAFDYAARQHGGEGALYVLLRRNRDGTTRK